MTSSLAAASAEARFERLRSVAARYPHLALLTLVVVALATEPMGESVWYLALRVSGIASSTPDLLSVDVGVSKGFDTAATLVQAVVVAGVLICAWRLRERSRAVALAALTPAAFLLTNRVFSSQFLPVLLAVWALAAALVVVSAREQLAVGAVPGAAACANAMVFPYTVWFAWELASAVMFALAFPLTAWLILRTVAPVGARPP